MSQYAIARHQEGICLNPLEYCIDGNGETIKFDTEAEAEKFLLEHGADKNDIGESIFIIDMKDKLTFFKGGDE